MRWGRVQGRILTIKGIVEEGGGEIEENSRFPTSGGNGNRPYLHPRRKEGGGGNRFPPPPKKIWGGRRGGEERGKRENEILAEGGGGQLTYVSFSQGITPERKGGGEGKRKTKPLVGRTDFRRRGGKKRRETLA